MIVKNVSLYCDGECKRPIVTNQPGSNAARRAAHKAGARVKHGKTLCADCLPK